MFSLGMSRKEAFRNLLFENVIISVLALAIALAAGTVLSFLFFSVIIYAIDVYVRDLEQLDKLLMEYNKLTYIIKVERLMK